jgi:hypothetical protein
MSVAGISGNHFLKPIRADEEKRRTQVALGELTLFDDGANLSRQI